MPPANFRWRASGAEAGAIQFERYYASTEMIELIRCQKQNFPLVSKCLCLPCETRWRDNRSRRRMIELLTGHDLLHGGIADF